MKVKAVLLVGILVLCLGVIGSSNSWANTLTYQDVTFNMAINGSGNLNLNIVNALGATGDWAGIDFLKAFQINNYGDASGLSVLGWTPEPGGLSAGGSGGCNLSGSGTCFSYPGSGFTLTNNFTLEIVKTAGAFNLSLSDGEGLFGPHLKVFFAGADQGDGHGNLLSQTVPVPEPGTALLFGLGMALLLGCGVSHASRSVAHTQPSL
jgi:hypothetical protein